MPASLMHCDTCCDVKSIFTPSAANTSAAPGLRRQSAIAMLCDRNAGAGHDEGRAGRNIEGARGVAAGTDHVHGVIRRIDLEHLGAHGRHRAGDLVDRLATHPERHEQAAHLRWRRFAGHHAVERSSSFVAREARAARDLGDERLEIVAHGFPRYDAARIAPAGAGRRPRCALKAAARSRKFFRIRWPFSEAMLSG